MRKFKKNPEDELKELNKTIKTFGRVIKILILIYVILLAANIYISIN